MPIQPVIQPFSGMVPAVMVPQMEMPISASRNISQDWNCSAMARIKGMEPTSSRMPTQLPRKEAVIERPSAWPPLPCLASG